MSIFAITGFAPVNFTLPLIVPPPCAALPPRAAIDNVSPPATSNPTKPSDRIMPPLL